MTSDPASKGHAMPSDILITIEQFRAGGLRLSAFLDRVWAQIHDLSQRLDVTVLEDLWMEIEIIYAQASAARQPTLDDEQAREVDRVMNELASALHGMD